jgi:type I restriction enzyme, S subunit
MSNKTKTTTTKEVATPALVPKLRFPEFRGAAAWEPATLGEKSSILKGKGISKADLDPSGSQACIRYGELYTRYAETIRDAVSRTKVPASELFLSKPDDVIIPSSGETKIDIAKASCVLAGGIALGGDLNVIRSKLNGTFLSYYLNGPKRLDIAKVAQGDTVVHLYPHQLEALYIAVPSPAEQQKIAECLSSVDELIAAQARKLDALKSHKKGLMQQLFPREGETQPRLRFPEFQNAGEWVDQSIGDFGKVVTGSTPSTAQPAFYGGGIPFASPADISDMRYVDQTKTTLTAEGFAETRHIRAGSVLFVCIGSTIGKAAQNVHDCATNQQINAVVPSSKHSDGFVYFALSFASERVALLAGRQAVPIINKSLFSSVRILAPALPEQQRIADCLTSLDDLIAAQTQKHEALKTHKKGLMQQLFPSPEEVVA